MYSTCWVQKKHFLRRGDLTSGLLFLWVQHLSHIIGTENATLWGDYYYLSFTQLLLFVWILLCQENFTILGDSCYYSFIQLPSYYMSRKYNTYCTILDPEKANPPVMITTYTEHTRSRNCHFWGELNPVVMVNTCTEYDTSRECNFLGWNWKHTLKPKIITRMYTLGLLYRSYIITAKGCIA